MLQVLKKKKPIDISIMVFRQMFDAEDFPTVLNAFYESGVTDDIFALVHETNETVEFAVKTPTGLTEKPASETKYCRVMYSVHFSRVTWLIKILVKMQ